MRRTRSYGQRAQVVCLRIVIPLLGIKDRTHQNQRVGILGMIPKECIQNAGSPIRLAVLIRRGSLVEGLGRGMLGAQEAAKAKETTQHQLKARTLAKHNGDIITNQHWASRYDVPDLRAPPEPQDCHVSQTPTSAPLQPADIYSYRASQGLRLRS